MYSHTPSHTHTRLHTHTCIHTRGHTHTHACIVEIVSLMIDLFATLDARMTIHNTTKISEAMQYYKIRLDSHYHNHSLRHKPLLLQLNLILNRIQRLKTISQAFCLISCSLSPTCTNTHDFSFLSSSPALCLPVLPATHLTTHSHSTVHTVERVYDDFIFATREPNDD